VEQAGFEAIDHTADVGLRVWADSLAGLFQQAARGMITLLTDPQRVTPRQAERIRVSGLDHEELLVAWLGEILYRFDTQRLLLAEFEAPQIEADATGWRLVATARGEPWDPARHPIRTVVKAATYHGLRLAPDATGRYATTIIFDA
jgi:SHS2 domain-containing protein